MIKLNFANSEEYIGAVKLVADDLGIEICEQGADYTLKVKKTAINSLNVSINKSEIAVTFGGGIPMLLRMKPRRWRAFANRLRR